MTVAGTVHAPESRIDSAVAEARRYCRWHVTPEVTETLVVDGSGSVFLHLPTLHIVSVASVKENGVELAAGSYQWSADGMLWRAWPWTGNFRAVEVTLTHGFQSADDFAGVVNDFAGRGPSGSQVRQVGQVAYQVAGDGLLEGERAILDRYRLNPRP